MRYFLLLFIFLAFPVAASPRDDVHAAFTRFIALKTFKAEVNASGGSYKTASVIEFQSPDRYRITSAGRPANIVIGDTMYMNLDGHAMKVPMPSLKATLAQYRNPDALKDLEVGTDVESMGTEILGQQATRKYRYTVSKPHPATFFIWISVVTGNILQMESNGTMNKKPWHSLTRYSQFNSPAIQITAP